MIKKISVQQLETGMYVHNLEASWLAHPFLSNSFLITDPTDIQKIRAIGLREIAIDTERGKDVPERSEQAPPPAALVPNGGTAQEPTASPQVGVREELARAQQVRGETQRVITELMRDVRLGKQVELERVEQAVKPMVASIIRNKDALLGLTRIRRMDRYTFEHSVSVAVVLLSFAQQMESDRDLLLKVGIGGLLHDIGKTLTPPEILNKPGKLTDEEFAIMRQHVVHSRDILTQSPGIHPISLAIAAEHHERHDGSGYPLGLRGEEISLYGQMAAIADVYDAITATRVYRKGVPPHEVMRKLMEWSQAHFNPVLVQQFVQCVGIYPVGSLVSLASGRIAVVLASGAKGLLYPLVRVVYDTHRRAFINPRDLDLSNLPPGSDERIVGSEPAGAWGIRPEVFLT